MKFSIEESRRFSCGDFLTTITSCCELRSLREWFLAGTESNFSFQIQRVQVNNSSFNEIKQERLALEKNYLPADLLRVLIHKIPYRSISPWARDGFAGNIKITARIAALYLATD